VEYLELFSERLKKDVIRESLEIYKRKSFIKVFDLLSDNFGKGICSFNYLDFKE
jgi:hypothetical protein